MKYIPKNVLITGGCGFIASNFINYLSRIYSNINIINIDKIDICSNLKYIELSNSDKYKFYKGNICNEDLINIILNDNNIDTVIHFAAQSSVDYSYVNSVQFTKDNILGTHILLECVRNYKKVKKFIHISTDEVYGEVDINNISNERSILNPTNPYSASKASAEMIVNSYIYSYNIPIIITRSNNVYGPNQYISKIIPKFIFLLLQDKKCTIHGNGKSIRSYIYVLDVCKAIDIILHKGKLHEIYNIGCENEFNNLEIVEKLVKLLKNDNKFDKYIEYIKDREYNDFRYSINYDKLTKLGWKEEYSFTDGLLKTIKWYKNNINLFINNKIKHI